MLPDYLNCISNRKPCDYFFSKECPESCELYVTLGIGGMVKEDIGRLEKEVNTNGK